MVLCLFGMTGMESVFAICAIFGSLLFLVRLTLFIIGGVADADADFDADGDIGDADIGDVDFDGDMGDVDIDADGTASSADTSFRLLTLQGFTAFFMMFGLVGLGLIRQHKLSEGMALIGGVIAGLIAVFIISLIFSMMTKLQSSGTIKLANAIGKEGTVYLGIPADGTGKVQITVQDRLKIYDAKSVGEDEIQSGDPVRVVKVVSGNILLVKKL